MLPPLARVQLEVRAVDLDVYGVVLTDASTPRASSVVVGGMCCAPINIGDEDNIVTYG